MKSLRKSILTLLALTLFGGAGAWAQGPTTVFEVDFSSTPTATTGSMRFGEGMSTSTVSIHNNTDLINSILMGAKYNYSNNHYISIKPATGSFQTGDTLLIAVCYNNNKTRTEQAVIYAANGTTLLFTTAPGISGYNESGDPVVEKFVLEQDADSLLIARSSESNYINNHVTTLKVLRPAAQEIELTKSGANQWTLGQTPDYDLELQVEYYEAHALKDIPAGWTVKINGIEQQTPYQGDSLMITETDSVTLVPAGNPRRVKSVTLADEGPAVQTVIIGGVTLQVVEGETWRQIAQRNPGVITADSEDDGYVYRDLDTVLRTGTAYLRPTDTYNSSLDYYWYEY